MIPDVHGRSTSDSDALQNNTTNSANFICGVVEGFYGRPWTSEQRKKLFKRMNVMGMNTYIYAPKDDSKHRMYWRELYTVEEAEMLTALVEAAEENGVTFVYALSPGLDMTYSSAKEVSCLKRKLTQVSSFGCKAFALLFDDIEVDMCEADKGFFQSFAFAQVSVTNEVYQHLHEPEKFFFCPTEYCASRAVPSVQQSEYLQTVGSKLLKGIDVMWTGPKVISKRISIKSIEELTAVLRRPPLIWDNIHANDYDQKRIFLGPYDGRSPELIPYLRGVLTNPNCEFESNFIALHTLAQWSRSNAGGVKKDCILSASPVNSADIKLETDGEYRVDEDTPAIHSSTHSYQAKQALRLALIDWHKELFDKCSAPRRLINSNHSLYPSYSFPTILPPAPILDPKSSSTTGSDSLPTLKTTLDPMAVLEMTDTYVKPPSAVIPLNGLIDQSSSSSSSSDDDDSLDMNNDSMPPQSTQLALQDYSNTEPMDYAPSSSSPSPTSSSSDGPPLTTSATADHTQDENDAGSMVIDTACDPAQHQNNDDIRNGDSVDNKALLTPDSLTSTHVSHLVDLFYLPFEHGRWSVESLSEFHWLKTNCPAAGVSSSNGEPTDEWKTRSVEYIARLRDMCNVIDRLCSIPNKALLHEIYPYVWDIKAAMVLIASFVQWLGQYKVKSVGQSCLLGGPYSWGNRGYGDYTLSGEREPWLFRGGVLGEFQRMLPFECCTDLLFYTIPESPRTTMFNIRPYTPADLESVYRVCVRTYNDGCDGSHICPAHPQVLPDRLIGAYLHDSSDMCFVIEDDTGCICGYVLSCTDARSYFNRYHTTWIPLMTSKYPQPSSTSPITSSQTAVSPAEELINEFYSCRCQKEISSSSASPSAAGQCTAVTCQPPGDSLLMRHPSMLRVDMLRASLAVDPTAPVRALACAAAALKVAGSCGVFTKVDITHTSTAEFYRRLGFFEITYTDPTTKSSSTTQPNTSNNSSSLSNANTSTTTTDTRTSNNLNHSKFIHMGRII